MNNTIRFTWFSLALNVLLGAAKLCLGLVMLSGFMCVNGLHNFAMAWAKHSCLRGMGPGHNHHQLFGLYRLAGILVLVASFLYAVYALGMGTGSSSPVFDSILAITIAAVTFGEIIWNIRGSFAAKKTERLMLQASRLVSLASSLIGLVLVQTALLSFTSKEDHSWANALSGLFLGSCAALVGLGMVIYAHKRQKKHPAH